MNLVGYCLNHSSAECVTLSPTAPVNPVEHLLKSPDNVTMFFLDGATMWYMTISKLQPNSLPGTHAIISMTFIEYASPINALPAIISSKPSYTYIYIIVGVAAFLVIVVTVVTVIRRRRKMQAKYINLKGVAVFEEATSDTCLTSNNTFVLTCCSVE